MRPERLSAITVDGQSAQDQTVTVRHRDSMRQEHVNIDGLLAYLMKHQ